MANDFNSSDDIIDSHDVIAKVEELESDIEDLDVEIEELEDEKCNKDDDIDNLSTDVGALDVVEDKSEIEDLENQMVSLRDEINDRDSRIEELKMELCDLKDELKPIKELADDGESYAADWLHGATLINESYFEEHAEQTAYDCGDISRDAGWPANCIDWEKAADQLKTDYNSIEFQGEEFWVRG